MNAIVKQIQEALEHGRPMDIKAGAVATQILKEIQKNSSRSEYDIQKRQYHEN